MSGILAGKVWLSALDADLKPLAATLADIGSDDGKRIYPSVAYMAWRLGRSERDVQRDLSKLREIGVLMIVGNAKGGRGKVTRYHLIESALPEREPWRNEQDSDEEIDTERVTEIAERVTRQVKRVTRESPDPLVVQPLEEPLDITENEVSVSTPKAEPYFRAFRERWRSATKVGCPRGKMEAEFVEKYVAACAQYGELEVLSMVDEYGVQNAEWIQKFRASPKKFFEEVDEIAEARKITAQRAEKAKLDIDPWERIRLKNEAEDRERGRK